MARKEKIEQPVKLKNAKLGDIPLLAKLKPREKYVFHSDYFDIDGETAVMLGFFHADSATDNFGAFWGVNQIPSGLPEGVSVVLLEQVRRMTDRWISEHQSRAESVASSNEAEAHRAGTTTSKTKATRRGQDLQQVAIELADGASYLHSHWRLLVKAKDVTSLDEAVRAIERRYLDLLGTVTVAPYVGEQRRELADVLAKNEKKLGHGFYFTSTEYAGHYNLVTHGLEDPHGEYVGSMVGDVNTSAVLFDVNGYRHHTIIADEALNRRLGRVRVADMWGSKLSQSCLMANGRVVHLVLNDLKLSQVGPEMKSITRNVNMAGGDVNMFEMFGSEDEELSIFPSQMEKLILMAEQAYETTDSDRSVIRGELQQIATTFYIDKKMWYENAIANRNRLRILNIPHADVPKLDEFVSYLDMEYKKLLTSSAKDPEAVHALKVLSVTFRNLLSNNGDLFNRTTNPIIDDAARGRRVVYEFGGLMRRGKGVAMAQLVNIIGFAVGNLGEGDTVIIHGAELIDDGVKEYMATQFGRLYDRGGRVVFCYGSVEKMLDDRVFCEFDKADYTIFGCLTAQELKRYQEVVATTIPPDLQKLIVGRFSDRSFVRRGFDNVVFSQDLRLGV